MSNWALEKGTHLAPKTGPVPDSCCDSLISGTNLLSCTVETGGVQELVSYTITYVQPEKREIRSLGVIISLFRR